MNLAPSLSPLMENSRNAIQSSLEKTISKLGQSVYESYLKGIHRFEKETGAVHHFPEWVIHHYFLFSGYIQAAVYYNDLLMFTFGTEVLPENFSPELLASIEMKFRRNNKTLIIKGYAPSDIENVTKKITEMDIIPFCKNIYFFRPEINDERYLDVFTPIMENINKTVKKGLEENSSVCFSHFRFQNLHGFFDFLGHQNSIEVTELIVKQMEDNFKKKDVIIQLSPDSYLVISAGIDGKKIKNRFQGIFFQARSIILDYNLNTASINAIPPSYFDLWKELEI